MKTSQQALVYRGKNQNFRHLRFYLPSHFTLASEVASDSNLMWFTAANTQYFNQEKVKWYGKKLLQGGCRHAFPRNFWNFKFVWRPFSASRRIITKTFPVFKIPKYCYPARISQYLGKLKIVIFFNRKIQLMDLGIKLLRRTCISNFLKRIYFHEKIPRTWYIFTFKTYCSPSSSELCQATCSSSTSYTWVGVTPRAPTLTRHFRLSFLQGES